MKPFVPNTYEHVAFALLLSGIQTLVASGISTGLAVGWRPSCPYSGYSRTSRPGSSPFLACCWWHLRCDAF